MSAEFRGLTEAEAREFAAAWLPAWTGNDPEWLASFYAEDAFYCDPAVPDGIEGREALVRYFTRLLGRYPDWVWTNVGAVPIEDGFLNRWHARVPARDGEVEFEGVCTVQLRDGLIRRNEVYFDRTALLAASRRA
ncbi:MAG: nuclear transport factor 2 family protein [Solirubrobacterales bacterium]